MAAVTNRIQQVYGYLVCLIAIITLLVSSVSFVNAVFDMTRPANIPRYGMEQGFPEYRLNQLERSVNLRDKSGGAVTIPTDSALRQQYNEQQRLQQETERWNGRKSIVTSAIMIVIALILFSIHWRWLRGLARQDEAHA